MNFKSIAIAAAIALPFAASAATTPAATPKKFNATTANEQVHQHSARKAAKAVCTKTVQSQSASTHAQGKANLATCEKS